MACGAQSELGRAGSATLHGVLVGRLCRSVTWPSVCGGSCWLGDCFCGNHQRNRATKPLSGEIFASSTASVVQIIDKGAQDVLEADFGWESAAGGSRPLERYWAG